MSFYFPFLSLSNIVLLKPMPGTFVDCASLLHTYISVAVQHFLKGRSDLNV